MKELIAKEITHPQYHQILSIDVKHDQMLEYFNHLEDTVIPNLESEKQNIKDCIRKLQNHEIQRLPVHECFYHMKKNLVRLYGIRKMCLQGVPKKQD